MKTTVSYMWAFFSLLPFMSGCSFLDKKTASLPTVDYRQGHIFAEKSSMRERFNFQYEYDHLSGKYHMKISAPFSPVLTLSCSSHHIETLQIELMGYEYYGEEAYNKLSSRLPNFPWEQLPEMIQTGFVESEQWEVVNWGPGQLQLKSNTGLKISWREI